MLDCLAGDGNNYAVVLGKCCLLEEWNGGLSFRFCGVGEVLPLRKVECWTVSHRGMTIMLGSCAISCANIYYLFSTIQRATTFIFTILHKEDLLRGVHSCVY